MAAKAAGGGLDRRRCAGRVALHENLPREPQFGPLHVGTVHPDGHEVSRVLHDSS
jgi:hypothetical protein